MLRILAEVSKIFSSHLLLWCSRWDDFVDGILATSSHIKCHSNCRSNWCSHSIEVWLFCSLFTHRWWDHFLPWSRAWSFITSTRSRTSLLHFPCVLLHLVWLSLDLQVLVSFLLFLSLSVVLSICHLNYLFCFLFFFNLSSKIHFLPESWYFIVLLIMLAIWVGLVYLHIIRDIVLHVYIRNFFKWGFEVYLLALHDLIENLWRRNSSILLLLLRKLPPWSWWKLLRSPYFSSLPWWKAISILHFTLWLSSECVINLSGKILLKCLCKLFNYFYLLIREAHNCCHAKTHIFVSESENNAKNSQLKMSLRACLSLSAFHEDFQMPGNSLHNGSELYFLF